MNTQTRCVVGLSIGIVLGLFLPVVEGDTFVILNSASNLVIKLGKLLLLPMIFFSMVIAIDKLRNSLLTVLYQTLLWILCSVVIAAVLGAFSIMIFRPERIPPMLQEIQLGTDTVFLQQMEQRFSANLFRLFVSSENVLGGVLLIGLLIGVSLRYEQEKTTPIRVVVESAAHIFFHLYKKLLQMLSFLLCVPVAVVMIQMRKVEELVLFGQFLLVLMVTAALLGVLIYPLVLYFLKRDASLPFRWLQFMRAPAFAAIASGDLYFSLAALNVTLDEKIPRKIGVNVSSVAAFFGRAGTVFVGIAGFLLVIRSYTALEIHVFEILLLVLIAILHSLFLGHVPAMSVLLLLSYIAPRYDSSLAESYLILLPIMPILQRIAVFLDIMTTGFITHAVFYKLSKSKKLVA